MPTSNKPQFDNRLIQGKHHLTTFDDYFELQMGKTPSRNRREYWSGENIIWISISDLSAVKSHVITNSKEHITQLAVDETDIKPIPPNTVVMSFKLSIGKVAITTKISYTNEAIIAFLPKNNINISPLYLYYSLQSYDWSQSGNRAVMGKTLNKATLKLLPFCLHAIDEQKQICAKLSLIDAAISIKTNQLVKLDKLIKSQFIELKHNKKQKITLLKNVCKIGSAKRVYHHELRSVGEVPFFKVSDIVQLSNSISPSKKQFLSNETYNELVLEHAIPLPEDILITTRGTIGVSYKMKVNDKFYFQDGMVSWIRVLDKSLISEFLSAYLQFEQCKLQMNKQSGSTVGYLSLKDLSNIQISYPDKLEQEKFICFKHAVDKSKFVVQQSIEKLELLKKSLMQQYFG